MNTIPLTVPFIACFRYQCPSCNAVNYVEPIPVTDQDVIDALNREYGEDNAGEEWKQWADKLEKEWMPEYCQMPRVSCCPACEQLVQPDETA